MAVILTKPPHARKGATGTLPTPTRPHFRLARVPAKTGAVSLPSDRPNDVQSSLCDYPYAAGVTMPVLWAATIRH
jgi:hypothetical protein